MGMLWCELIDNFGIDKVCGFLICVGYIFGVCDVQLVCECWFEVDFFIIFMVGIWLYMLEGVVKVILVSFSYDFDSGCYEGEFLWYNFSEVDEYLVVYGVVIVFLCWQQIGYVIGYVSMLLGYLVIFCEVECCVMGMLYCCVIGKLVELWSDVEDDLCYFNVQDFVGSGMLVIDGEVVVNSYSGFSVEVVEVMEVDLMCVLVGIFLVFNVVCYLLNWVVLMDVIVFFMGELGVGKECFVCMLYQIGCCECQFFVVINCVVIFEMLIEIELFGVECGVYIGVM